MNVGAGQYISSSDAITILPTMPPNLAATIEIATPVALKHRQNELIVEIKMNVTHRSQFGRRLDKILDLGILAPKRDSIINKEGAV